MYFWATGLLSSFLDNAPTYLVFFNLAGGDAQALMTTGATTLAAISAARCSWARTATSAMRRTSW
jgi:Na+/H+ antiporter NhaD/arsenite permease-like protein